MSKRPAKRHSVSNKPAQQQTSKTERSLLEKVEALDDHLFLLRDAWHNLWRDDARLKILASELRLLICLSSGTEGLLWRLTQELKVDESVYVHVPGEVDLNHPLSRGLQFMHMPLYRGGKGDPRVPVRQLNFRLLVKNRPAIFVEGEHITHEKMIGLVANEIGSGHESDKVSHKLQFLRNFFINDRPPFVDILASDAEFTLEIAEQVIAKAEAAHGFKRKSRRGYGDFSITIRAQLNDVLEETTHLASFESAVSKIILRVTVSESTISYQFTKFGNTLAAVEAPLPLGWKPITSAVFCLSYSSQHEQARVIVSGVAVPQVKVPLGFVDIREMTPMPMEESKVLSKQLVLTHERLLRADEVKKLTEGAPPYFGGLLKPGDSEDPVFP
jgi:hypothetical protein